MSDILNTIRNARDGSMVDIRYDKDGKGAIASFPIESLRALIQPLRGVTEGDITRWAMSDAPFTDKLPEQES